MRRPNQQPPSWAISKKFSSWLRKNNEILVFATDIRGERNVGGSFIARTHYGAEGGEWWGPTGRCYAIPMYGTDGRTVGEDRKRMLVNTFLGYAINNPSMKFRVTRLSSKFYDGLFAQLFRNSPSNVILPKFYIDNVK